MAITIDDFSKIWASTSPLTPYSFSESNYKEGWNFIGGTPPSRQMWDFIQKQNDEKLKYLLDNFDDYAKKTDLDDYLPLAGGTLTGDVLGVTPPDGDNSKKLATTEFVTAKAGNYLPLSGGTMTGSIQYVENGKVFSIGNTDPGNVDLGWNCANREGAGIGLRSADHLKNPGEFSLFARDSANSCTLDGKPDGSLTWGGISLTDGTFIKVQQVQIPVASGTGAHVGIATAPAISGYEFVAWIYTVSDGDVYPCYCSQVVDKATDVWVPVSHRSDANGTQISCYALYVRKW